MAKPRNPVHGLLDLHTEILGDHLPGNRVLACFSTDNNRLIRFDTHVKVDVLQECLFREIGVLCKDPSVGRSTELHPALVYHPFCGVSMTSKRSGTPRRNGLTRGVLGVLGPRLEGDAVESVSDLGVLGRIECVQLADGLDGRSGERGLHVERVKEDI